MQLKFKCYKELILWDNQYNCFFCAVFLGGIYSFSVKDLFHIEVCFPKECNFRLETLN